VLDLSETKVLIADSSSANIDMLIAILSTDPEIQVVGVATTGEQTIDLVSSLKPDILTISESLQGVVPVLEVIKQIMAYNPTPILILADPNCEDRVFEGISVGALDVIEKPASPAANSELVKKVKLLSRIKVVTHLAGKFGGSKRSTTIQQRTLFKVRRDSQSTNQRPRETQFGALRLNKLVAIAASTGGPSALAVILRRLPVELGIGIVIVQHVAEGFGAGLAEWLDKESGMTVREAQDGDQIKPGHAFLAPTGFHMVVRSGSRIGLNRMPPMAGHRPSADVLFESAAWTYRRDCIGVILTGMGADGAKGIVAIKNAGGKTIAQDEQSCVIFGMPKAAIQTGVIDKVLPLDAIAEEITQEDHTKGGD